MPGYSNKRLLKLDNLLTLPPRPIYNQGLLIPGTLERNLPPFSPQPQSAWGKRWLTLEWPFLPRGEGSSPLRVWNTAFSPEMPACPPPHPRHGQVPAWASTVQLLQSVQFRWPELVLQPWVHSDISLFSFPSIKAGTWNPNWDAIHSVIHGRGKNGTPKPWQFL